MGQLPPFPENEDHIKTVVSYSFYIRSTILLIVKIFDIQW